MSQLIIGAGGGGKGGGGSARVAQEAPDSLRSKAYARVVDLISEGEIEGLVDGLQSVYLDDTPIQNPDGSTNFSGVTLETRNGSQQQSYVPGFSSVENEVVVGVEVKASQPVGEEDGMPVVYVAGRFRGSDSWVVHCNIHAAECGGRGVVDLGAMPLIPHAIGAHMEGTATDAFWLTGTLELMRRCDAVLVLPGWESSEGTKGEIAEAARCGIPVVLPENGKPNYEALRKLLSGGKHEA